MKTNQRTTILRVLVLLGLPLNLWIAQQAGAVSFTNTGTMNRARAGHSATLLRNGKVLVTAGYNGAARLADSELYEPATGVWTNTSALAVGRTRHTATLLPNGLVLVASGGTGPGIRTTTCELYNPFEGTGTWTFTGPMAGGRGGHTATLLLDGKVLVAGGDAGVSSLNTSELYDPVAGTWTNAGSLTTPRDLHKATLLGNGKVLVTGGSPDDGGTALASAEVYDPVTMMWSATTPMAFARGAHIATLLPNGQVLVAGGITETGTIRTVELYDPVTGRWKPTGAMAHARSYHTATLLADGKIMVEGGYADGFVPLVSAEIYDPATGNWTPTSSPNAARGEHTATLLPDGKVLVAGGYNDNLSVWLSSAELYESAAGPITLVNAAMRPDGVFQFAFTGAPSSDHTVLATTNVALPLVNWAVLGVVPEFSPGLFFYSDSQTTNGAQRFYEVVKGDWLVGRPCQGPNPCPCRYICVNGVWTSHANCRNCYD